MTELLSVLVLVGTGVVAGVFFAVAISVMPALIAMPPDRYVFTHKLLGRHYDRVMPLIVLGSGTADAVLAARADGAGRWAFAAAAACMVGVALVSQTRNVPINNRVKRLAPEEVGPDWDDPRTSWRDWHLVRTAFAFAGCALTAVGVVL
ncbi:anthrone oxygenase family protein [Spirillospora sp. CA-253888]